MSGDTLVNAETGELIAQCTPTEARWITNRLRTAIGVATELYIEAYERRAWAALGHANWDAYCAAEFGDFQLKLPREERDEAIQSLRDAGLSIRAIASTGVASKKTVERTIAASGVAKEDTCTTGTDGKRYNAVSRAKANRAAEPEPDAPSKCTDGFDCPATPGADGLCAWHRSKRQEQDSGGGGSRPAAPDDGTGQTAPHPVAGETAPSAVSPALELAAEREQIARDIVAARRLLEHDPARVVEVMDPADCEVWAAFYDDMADAAYRFGNAMRDRNQLRSVQ